MKKQPKRVIGLFVALWMGTIVPVSVPATAYAMGQTATTYQQNQVREIGTLEAFYTGDQVLVGDSYRESDVIVTAYYKDDVTRSEGFIVTPIFGSRVVTREGKNVFTLTYLDPASNRMLQAKINVTGYLSAEGFVVARYTGGRVQVGQKYDPSKVIVEFVRSDGSTEKIRDYTVNGDTVTMEGENRFTVSFTRGGITKTTDFVVPGYRAIGDLVAVYTGGNILVGNEYSIDDVEVTAYFEDDAKRGNGFKVIPNFGDRKVRAEGENTFELTYQDPNTGKVWKATIVVYGYTRVLTSIEARYTGESIVVGNPYDKEKVEVVAYFEDGTSCVIPASGFEVNATMVYMIGANEYKVTCIMGNIQKEALFTVEGVEKGSGVGTDSDGQGYIPGDPSNGQGTGNGGKPTGNGGAFSDTSGGNSSHAMSGTGIGQEQIPPNQTVQTGDTIFAILVLCGSLVGVSGTVITFMRQMMRLKRRMRRRAAAAQAEVLTEPTMS